jgi:hypothetical protein
MYRPQSKVPDTIHFDFAIQKKLYSLKFCEPIIEIDDQKLSWDEFGQMLTTYAGWGMRLTIVPDDETHLTPKVVIQNQRESGDGKRRCGLDAPKDEKRRAREFFLPGLCKLQGNADGA